ncbi:MAG TPA: ABC transporter ATP-binding protein [Pseudacidobacterium sp.]|nr:ABC transporter ATP-binding protein [Pseudacidobacterium sp.]
MGTPLTSSHVLSAGPVPAGLAPLSPWTASEHPYVRVENLRKEYATGRGRLVLFDGLSFEIRKGEFLAIVGQSGAGKSTLLHILGALDVPTSGNVYCASTPLRNLSPGQAAAFRNREVGYVWQFHYLLPEFTALENVAMPLLARGETRAEAFRRARGCLREVGLEDRAEHQAGELSGGEQQRVSLARALVTQPGLLLADEPTGDLDSQTADTVFSLLQRLHEKEHLTSVIVTHNMTLARRCHRVLRLEKGRMEELSPQEIQRRVE